MKKLILFGLILLVICIFAVPSFYYYFSNEDRTVIRLQNITIIANQEIIINNQDKIKEMIEKVHPHHKRIYPHMITK